VILLLSTAFAWTCAEATNLYANAATDSLGSARLRTGAAYSPEALACIANSDIPESARARLRAQEGEPFQIEPGQSYETVVLDLGCGALTVTAGDELSIHGFTSGDEPVLETMPGTATLRGRPSLRDCADLEVEVPREARLLVYHRGTYVAVHGMEGPVEVEAARADVVVTGPSKVVEVKAPKGSVYVDVSGSVEVSGGQGTVAVGAGNGSSVRVTTVGGAQFLWGGPLRKAELSSVEGSIRTQSTFLAEAVVDARSQNGDVLIGLASEQIDVSSPSALRPPSLFHSPESGALRPDRQLPGGQHTDLLYFEWLPTEARALWATTRPAQIVPTTGARIRGVSTPSSERLRVVAHSLSGFAGAVELPRTPAAPLGPTLAHLRRGATAGLASCRPDLAEPVPAGAEDLWATIRFANGKATTVTFDAEGFDPRLTACIEKQMKSWTVPDPSTFEVDWPLRLRLVRSGSPP